MVPAGTSRAGSASVTFGGEQRVNAWLFVRTVGSSVCLPGYPSNYSQRRVLRLPLSTIKATWPVLSHPSNRHKAVPFTPEQFRYAFTNTLTEEASLAAYERYHIPAPGRIVFDGAVANFDPHAATKVDFEKEHRAPLLFIAGGADHIIPPAVNESNANHYTTSTVEFKEFPGRSHFTVGQDGWEEVADYALDWALEHSAHATAAESTAAV